METQLTYLISAPLSTVKSTLGDMKKYGALHPLIKSVTNTEGDAKQLHNFRIKEKPFTWLPITIFYEAELMTTNDTIEYHITGIPLTKAYLHYDFNKISETETEVIFNLKIKSKLPGKKILQYKMIKAQNQLIEAIRQQ